MSTPPRVLLLGMMGAGKTTVGRALSARTGWPYLDNDELVALAYGRPTPEVLAEAGEDGLRAVESAALGAALAAEPPVIAGVAAGVVESAHDRDRMRAGGVVVWLRATIDTLVARVGEGEGRPWLSPDPRTALETLYVGRAELYAQVAEVVVDVDRLTPAEVVTEILRAAPVAGHQ